MNRRVFVNSSLLTTGLAIHNFHHSKLFAQVLHPSSSAMTTHLLVPNSQAAVTPLTLSLNLKVSAPDQQTLKSLNPMVNAIYDITDSTFPLLLGEDQVSCLVFFTAHWNMHAASIDLFSTLTDLSIYLPTFTKPEITRTVTSTFSRWAASQPVSLLDLSLFVLPTEPAASKSLESSSNSMSSLLQKFAETYTRACEAGHDPIALRKSALKLVQSHAAHATA